MNKIAVFGNAGAGKSTTSKRLADITNLPLYALDKLQFKIGGEKIPHEQYLKSHDQILTNDEWIIDGFGCLESMWRRLAEADTLIFIDLPIMLHYYWVTKRFFKGIFRPPEGWPDKSPLLKSTLTSYRVLWLCHRKLTPTYRQYVSDAAKTKRVYHLKSKADIMKLFNSLS